MSLQDFWLINLAHPSSTRACYKVVVLYWLFMFFSEDYQFLLGCSILNILYHQFLSYFVYIIVFIVDLSLHSYILGSFEASRSCYWSIFHIYICPYSSTQSPSLKIYYNDTLPAVPKRLCGLPNAPRLFLSDVPALEPIELRFILGSMTF